MENHETRQGILALIDIVNFTGQANKLGEKYTAQYSQYFQKKIKSIVMEHKFRAIKFLGDAALIFGQEPAELLGIMIDLFERDKPEDKYGFISRFRLVAHFGFFQFQIKNQQPADLVSAEGIKVFRMEKYAAAGELMVTRELYQGLKSLLTSRNIEAQHMKLEQSFKGFDSEEWFPPFYKLKIARKELGSANLLEQRMEELDRDVQFIRVFGNIYSPVPMDKNFINLSIHCDWDKEPDFACEEFLEDDDEPGKGTKPIRGKAKREREEDDWIFIEKMERRYRPDFKEIDVNTLYENKGNRYTNGVIFGLPGAGKTTILRHLAYKEFKANKTRERREKGRERIIMFVPCRGIPFYDTWHKEQYGPGRVETDENNALEYMTWVFLFDGKASDVVSPEERVEFRNAVNKVKQAFKENRLTLLVDALDEAPDSPSKERIKELVLLLTSQNRVFLTSRPSERIHLRQEKLPVFNVLSLTMEQVRKVARQLMEDDSFIYRKFDKAIWQEEIVVKMATTPITALLVTAYFQVYGQFDHRYPMYDLLMKFILVKVWENIKTDAFPYKNLELFFKEVKEKGFFEKYTDAGTMYDGLGYLCYRLFFEGVEGKVQRLVPGATLRAHFKEVTAGTFNYDEDKVTAFVDQWIRRFQEDHLLLQAGAGEYVFIHSTIMEYLAAFHLVRQAKKDKENLPGLVQTALEKQEFLGLETIPIASGNDLLEGFTILAVIRDLQVDYDRDLLDELGIKCLAEVEWQITKTLQGLRIVGLRKKNLDIIREQSDSFGWVYDCLKKLVLNRDKASIKENIERFDAFTKLSRDTLLEEHLDYDAFNDGDMELVNLRKQLLLKRVQKELVELWIARQEKSNKDREPGEEYDCVLQLDTPGYHPEDKNFKYFQNIIGKEFKGFLGSPNMRHFSGVLACAFSSDGKTFLSGDADGTLKLWDSDSGKEMRTFSGHKDSVRGCAFSPDGTYLLSASDDQTLKLWDAASGKEMCTFSGHKDSLWGCAFSPDGTRLLSASDDQTLKLWDAASSKEMRAFSGHKDSIRGCAFSLDGTHLLSASDDQTLKLWDAASGKEICTFSGHKAPVNSCTFSPDEAHLLSASSDHTLKLWDAVSGKEICTFSGHQASVRDCAFSPDGTRLLSASRDQTLKLWDAVSGKEMRTFSGHKAYVLGCAFSPDGTRLLSASRDKTLKLWDAVSGKEMRTFSGHKDYILGCAFSPDGTRLLSASMDSTLKLWDAKSGKEIRTFSGHKASVYSCRFCPDGKRLLSASYDKTLKLWDARSGKEMRTFSGHKASVYSCASSLDGRLLLSASEDKTLKLWAVARGREMRTLPGHKAFVNSCAFSPDGTHLLSASSDQTLKLWDTASGKEMRTFSGHKAPVLGCAFSPDGTRLLSASSDQTLKLWDASSGKCIKTLQLPWIPYEVTFSPQNPTLAVTANQNGTLTLFDFGEL